MPACTHKRSFGRQRSARPLSTAGANGELKYVPLMAISVKQFAAALARRANEPEANGLALCSFKAAYAGLVVEVQSDRLPSTTRAIPFRICPTVATYP